MTQTEYDQMIDQRVAVMFDTPVVAFNSLHSIVNVPIGSWWALTRHLTPEEKPSMFRVGGRDCLFAYDAAPWLKSFVRRDPRRFGITEATK